MHKQSIYTTLLEIAVHFEKPLSEAAALLGRSSSKLKQELRALGIPRWPFRFVTKIIFCSHSCRKINSIRERIRVLHLKDEQYRERHPLNGDRSPFVQQMEELELQIQMLKANPAACLGKTKKQKENDKSSSSEPSSPTESPTQREPSPVSPTTQIVIPKPLLLTSSQMVIKPHISKPIPNSAATFVSANAAFAPVNRSTTPTIVPTTHLPVSTSFQVLNGTNGTSTLNNLHSFRPPHLQQPSIVPVIKPLHDNPSFFKSQSDLVLPPIQVQPEAHEVSDNSKTALSFLLN